MSGDAFPVAENISIANALHGSLIRRYRFSVSDTGATLIHWGGGERNEQLAWFDRSGKQLEAVGPVSQMAGIALAPEGHHIAAAMGRSRNSDLWLLDGTRGTSSRLTFGAGPNLGPVFSPDGSRVAFHSLRAGGSGLYQTSANGTGAEEMLMEIKGSVFLYDWSHDGRFLTYGVNDPVSQRDVWVLPLDGSRKPYPLLKTNAHESFSRFSPDGKWISYQSDESGMEQVYVQPFPPEWELQEVAGIGRWRRGRAVAG